MRNMYWNELRGERTLQIAICGHISSSCMCGNSVPPVPLKEGFRLGAV